MTTRAARLVWTALGAGALVAGLPAVTQAQGSPTIAVTPSTGLVDYQEVVVTGTGYTPNFPLEVFQCRGGAVDENDCDASNAFEPEADDEGNVAVRFRVDARIYLPGNEEVDCRTDPAGCEIGLGYVVDADEWPEVALSFDPDAPLRPPVSATVVPTTGLVDDQVVRVEGEHLSSNEEAFTYVCAVGDAPPGERCDLDRLVRDVPDASGAVELEVSVRRRFRTPLGVDVDCDTHPGGCVVVLSWSFFGAPDRRDEVPISFAALPPATTTTTSAPTTTAAEQVPIGAPPAPPTAAVPGRPSFTG